LLSRATTTGSSCNQSGQMKLSLSISRRSSQLCIIPVSWRKNRPTQLNTACLLSSNFQAIVYPASKKDAFLGFPLRDFQNLQCWLAVVSVSKRGSVFLRLDALAKWSLVDIFVLIVSVTAFRVSIQSPDVDFLPDGFYSVDVLVVSLCGSILYYANMIAQLISQKSVLILLSTITAALYTWHPTSTGRHMD
jgi:hypothetical protein